ncbi:TPA: hypothetical protein NH808_006214 [Pseudomonas aeruginosa]|uniref:hypothetical protein n=1 Tax=Pseudomonas aeruginosa TaxID=287 RepID=UPI00044CA2B0|nr:hypothetical protein [Pseudomonas aeruginosa]ELM7151806.1 hypothetical protein [Pseudomonas aeruginosa]ETV00174.1 hypothetical protein Q094_00092 [Pseudomonas aeruginosa PS42]MBI7367513.1 hypothetical protein [Pseudomonas aeruginosa]NPS72362.1 hypothetical protein [Pseudomonas aeruginosa]PQM11441.1 hypothetical protein C5F85_16625 [Pseudomonas aeruginosa]
MQTIKLKLVGQSPLLMHGDRFANPLDEATKQHKVLTSKRKKLDEDHADIAKSEWMGSLYHDQEVGVFVPGQNIKSALVGAAKIQRLGSAFKRAVLVLDDKCKLEYSGPRDPEAIFANPRFVDARSVVVGTSRLIRYRPKFSDWSTTVEIMYSPEMIERDDVIRAAENAGLFVGLCDYRPEKGGAFGRFSVEVLP